MNIHAANKLRAKSCLLAITLLFTAMAYHAQAQSIAADPADNAINVSSSTDVTLTVASQGYDFFSTAVPGAKGGGNQPDLVSPASYATVTDQGGAPPQETNTQLDIGGTVYNAGITFTVSNPSATLATVTITESGSFTMSLLEDSYGSDDMTVQLTSASGIPLGSAVVLNSPPAPAGIGNTPAPGFIENDFFAVSVNDVVAGETITISAGADTVNGAVSDFSGVAFSNFVPAGGVTVPEPSTYALMGLGALALVLKLRARRA